MLPHLHAYACPPTQASCVAACRCQLRPAVLARSCARANACLWFSGPAFGSQCPPLLLRAPALLLPEQVAGLEDIDDGEALFQWLIRWGALALGVPSHLLPLVACPFPLFPRAAAECAAAEFAAWACICGEDAAAGCPQPYLLHRTQPLQPGGCGEMGVDSAWCLLPVVRSLIC